MKHGKKCHLLYDSEWRGCLCFELYCANGRKKIDIPCEICNCLKMSARNCKPCKRILSSRRKEFKLQVRKVRLRGKNNPCLIEKLQPLQESYFEIGEKVWTAWREKGDDIQFIHWGEVVQQFLSQGHYLVKEKSNPGFMDDCNFYHFINLLKKKDETT